MMAAIRWPALLLLASLTVFAQLDMQARTDPAYLNRVPEIFKSFALTRQVLEGVETGDDELVRASRRQLRQRPIPSESLTAFAIVEARAGRNDIATHAMAIAASRGWRDPLAQSVLAEQAVAAGDWTLAAKRVGALVANNETGNAGYSPVARVMAHREVRQAMGALLGANPAWADQMLDWAIGNLQGAALAEVVATALRNGARIDCGKLSAASSALLLRGNAASAQRLWAGRCARSVAGHPNDLGLNLPETAGGDPFNWYYPRGPLVARRFREEAGAVVMDYEILTDLVWRPLALKLAVFAPGNRQVLIAPRMTGSSGLDIRVECIGVSGAARALAVSKQGDLRTFAIPAENCAVQRLTLVGTGRGGGVRLTGR